MNEVEKILEDANKFYKLKEYQKAIDTCNYALSIEPFNNDIYITKLKCFLGFVESVEDLESKIKKGDKIVWHNCRCVETVYNDFCKIMDVNDSKDYVYEKIGNDKIEECKYIVNLLKNNEDPYNSEVIEKKGVEQVEKINEMLEACKQLAKEKSFAIAYAIIHDVFMQYNDIDSDVKFVIDSVPTMHFYIKDSDFQYGAWRLEYTGEYRANVGEKIYTAGSFYEKDDDLHYRGESKVVNEYATCKQHTFASIKKEAYGNSLEELCSELKSAYEYYIKRYEYGVKVKNKLNEFIKNSNIFTRTKKVKNLCEYLKIDYYGNNIYFTEVTDFSVLFRLGGSKEVDIAGSSYNIEEIEKYIEEYK